MPAVTAFVAAFSVDICGIHLCCALEQHSQEVCCNVRQHTATEGTHCKWVYPLRCGPLHSALKCALCVHITLAPATVLSPHPFFEGLARVKRLRNCNQDISLVRVLLQDKGSGKGSLGCKLWPLDKHVDFDHQHAWEKSGAPSAPTLKPKDVKYNVKVRC